MSRHTSELPDAQWAHIAPLLPEPKASPNHPPLGGRCAPVPPTG